MTSANGSKAPTATYEADREAHDVARQAQEDAVRILLDAAEKIRAGSQHAPDATATHFNLARGLEQSATYLKGRPAGQVDSMDVDDDEMPAWGWLLLAFIVGFLTSRFLRKEK